MKILVTGSSGLVGTALSRALAAAGHTVCRLVRPQNAAGEGAKQGFAVAWNPATGELGGAGVGADAVVNLAGASIADGRWTAEALKAEALGIRTVLARFGIVLAREGGALPKMLLPFKFGAGGRLGSGKHWMSWVTLEDVVGILRFAIENASVRVAGNVAPV